MGIYFMDSIRFNRFAGNWLWIIWIKGWPMDLVGTTYYSRSLWINSVCFDLNIEKEDICALLLLELPAWLVLN